MRFDKSTYYNVINFKTETPKWEFIGAQSREEGENEVRTQRKQSCPKRRSFIVSLLISSKRFIHYYTVSKFSQISH